MDSIITKCTGVILATYDSETGTVSNDAIRIDKYDFYAPNVTTPFKIGDKVSYTTISEPPTGRRIVKNIVRR